MRKQLIFLYCVIFLMLLIYSTFNAIATVPPAPRAYEIQGTIQDMWLEDNKCNFLLRIDSTIKGLTNDVVECSVYYVQSKEDFLNYSQEYNFTYPHSFEYDVIIVQDDPFRTIKPESKASSQGWKIGDNIQGIVLIKISTYTLLTYSKSNTNYANLISQRESIGIAIVIISIIVIFVGLPLIGRKRAIPKFNLLYKIIISLFIISVISLFLLSRDLIYGIIAGLLLLIIISIALFIEKGKNSIWYPSFLFCLFLISLIILLFPLVTIDTIKFVCCLPSTLYLLLGIILLYNGSSHKSEKIQ